MSGIEDLNEYFEKLKSNKQFEKSRQVYNHIRNEMFNELKDEKAIDDWYLEVDEFYLKAFDKAEKKINEIFPEKVDDASNLAGLVLDDALNYGNYVKQEVDSFEYKFPFVKKKK